MDRPRPVPSPVGLVVSAHGRGRGAVGEQVELAFLDAVFHVAAGAIDLLVEVAGLMLAASQRGDDKTRVGLAAGPLGLADDAARPAPAIQRRPGKVLEAPCRLAGLLAVLARPT